MEHASASPTFSFKKDNAVFVMEDAMSAMGLLISSVSHVGKMHNGNQRLRTNVNVHLDTNLKIHCV